MINNSAQYGGAFYSTNPFLIMKLKNNTFINNHADYGGAIYKTSDVSNYNLYQETTLQINSTNFLGNSASIMGGSIFLRREDLFVNNSKFNASQAKYGGALYYSGIKNISSGDVGFENTIFDSNCAQILGGAMVLLLPFGVADNMTNSTSLKLINNTDPRNQPIVTEKLSYFHFSLSQILPGEEKIDRNDKNLHEMMADESRLKLLQSFDTSYNSPPGFNLSIKSGHPLDLILTIQIYDEKKRLADFIHEGGINIDIKMNETDGLKLQAYLEKSPITISFQNATAYIKNRLVIFSQPRTSTILRFRELNGDLNFFSDNNLTINQIIQVEFRDCDLGDAYNPTTTACVTCPEGSYSLSDPYKNQYCTPCNDQVAFCFGGINIAPRPGFWRYNLTFDKILACPISQACAGGSRDDKGQSQGECNFPYEGNLCNQCTTGFAKDSSSQKCVKCQGNVFYYVKAALFLIAQLCMTFFALISSLKKIGATESATKIQTDSVIQTNLDKQEAFNSSVLRTAFSYLQICGIIAQLDIAWPDWVLETISYINGVSPGGQGGFSPSCIMKLFRDNDIDVYFIQLVITLIKPFLYWISLACLYLFYLVCTRKLSQSYQKLRKNLKVFFLIPAYMCQPSIIQATFTLFRCENFSSDESPVYFLLDQTEVQCWTKFHILWSMFIGLPNLILWTIVLPLLLLKIISKDTKQTKGSSQKDFEYSFIYTGLKHQKFFWEFVIMIRKVLFIIILVFFNMISDETQVFAIFGLLSLFAYIQYKFSPFEDRRLNFLELFSLFSLNAVAYSGISLRLEGDEWLNTMFISFALAVNLVFLVTLVFYFVESYREIAKVNIQKFIQACKKKLAKAKNSSNYFSSLKDLFGRPKKTPPSLSSEPPRTSKAADQDVVLKSTNSLSKIK